MEASIAEIDVMLFKSNLLAPFSGTVTRRYLDPGTIAPASAAVIRLVEQQHLEAWVGLPVSVVAELNVGDRQEVLVDGIPYSTVVAAKIPELDPATRTQTIVFEFDKHAADSVVSGQLCEVPIKTLVAGSGFWIPTSALSKGIRGLWSVMVVVPAVEGNGFRTEKRDIEIINTTEANVLARGTINQGDRIVVDGIHRIADGQLVEPNERP
jgi:RND family efflux transporter MFP subunit